MQEFNVNMQDKEVRRNYRRSVVFLMRKAISNLWGKNAHVHAVPKSCTPAEYAKATGVEALFGYLFLSGQKDRANEIFNVVMKEL